MKMEIQSNKFEGSQKMINWCGIGPATGHHIIVSVPEETPRLELLEPVKRLRTLDGCNGSVSYAPRITMRRITVTSADSMQPNAEMTIRILNESYDDGEMDYDKNAPDAINEVTIKQEEDIQSDIAMVRECKAVSEVPLIPYSRLSSEFKQYLSRLKNNLVPGIFKDANWKKKPWGSGRKPYVASITEQDISKLCYEAFRLGQKYGKSQQEKFYNYLTTLILKSKVECIDSYRQSGSTIDLYAQDVLADTRKVILFQFYMFEELVQRHLESEYMKKKKRNT
ncbi:unnamed protein product [Orchesella dallaii]|uniref:Uncharacterized protein n=1 Tax=Orchesella dallaii TaxID=48710 RepID=A0ABP1R960_9HEXA